MKTAVLLMAHGSPDSLDQMEPYLKHVMTRRPPTPEFVDEMRARYRRIGGRSPLLEITRRQAGALSRRLSLPVQVGMRHWTPFIQESVEELRREGIERVIGLAAAPHYSPISGGAYQTVLEKAAPDLKITLIRSWAGEPALHQCWASRLRVGPSVLFTAHSIPVEGAEPYPQELQTTVRGIVDLLPGVEWSFAYQSRSPSPIPWLGPEIPEKLKELSGREVWVAPIGFISEHVETLYDLDVLHRSQAEALGIRWTRVPMPNDDPLLIEAMAHAVESCL